MSYAIYRLNKNPFKSHFLPCILADFSVKHPVSFDDPCRNQFARWCCHGVTITQVLCFYPILPFVFQCTFYRPIDAHINWLAQVSATARDVLYFNSKTLYFFYYRSHHVDAKRIQDEKRCRIKRKCVFPWRKTLFDPHIHH